MDERQAKQKQSAVHIESLEKRKDSEQEYKLRENYKKRESINAAAQASESKAKLSGMQDSREMSNKAEADFQKARKEFSEKSRQMHEEALRFGTEEQKRQRKAAYDLKMAKRAL